MSGVRSRRRTTCGLLDGIKLSNPPDGRVCNGRALCLVDIDELAPDVGGAGDLADLAGPIQVFKPGIAVGVHPAGLFGQVILGMLAFAVGRDLISSHCPPSVQGRWRGAGDVFQLFGHIFAEAAQLAAALGAFCITGRQLDLDARNVIRDWSALRLVGGCILGLAQLGRHRGDGDLGHLQGQLPLVRGLGRRPEAIGAMAF